MLKPGAEIILIRYNNRIFIFSFANQNRTAYLTSLNLDYE